MKHHPTSLHLLWYTLLVPTPDKFPFGWCGYITIKGWFVRSCVDIECVYQVKPRNQKLEVSRYSLAPRPKPSFSSLPVQFFFHIWKSLETQLGKVVDKHTCSLIPRLSLECMTGPCRLFFSLGRHSLVPRPTPFFALQFVLTIIHGGGRAQTEEQKPSWPGNKVRPDVRLCCVRRVWYQD